MNEIEAKRIIATLSWISKYYKIPKTVRDQTEGIVKCSGRVSKSEIRISIGNFSITVDRDGKYGIVGDPKRQINYAEVNDGSRLQCNLNEDNEIIAGYILSGGPSGEINVNVNYNRVQAQLFGSSTEFEFQ